MKTTMILVGTLTLLCGPLMTSTHAQTGMGEPTGVARQAIKPETVSFSGKLVEIKTGPCEKTTGRSPIGTHILLEIAKGEKLNIHLGPAAAVADTVAKLSVGQEVTVKAFRTEKMPDNHYTARSLTFGKTTVELRDAGLRPVWASGSAVSEAFATVQEADQSATQRPGRGGGGPPWARGQRGGRPPWAGGRQRGGPPWAGGGAWQGGRGPDAMFEADREIFHSLLEDHQQIRRTVTKRDNGVETVTESADPNVALAIQGHVAAMQRRVEKIQPIHMRDPLFAALFGKAAKITMKITNTEKGVRVVETSDDPYAVKLIQAHAAVVSKFVANGFPEARENHAVPQERP
jgi:hypothetical protein